MRPKTFFLAIMLLISSPAMAQIYKWIDSDGTVHYGDAKNMPDSAKSQEVELGETNTITSVTFDKVMVPQDNVVMYSASWCGYCRKARNYFQAKGIPFIEYDIEKNRAAATRHKKMGGSGVPVILYRDKRMNGFSEAGFERMYRKGA